MRKICAPTKRRTPETATAVVAHAASVAAASAAGEDGLGSLEPSRRVAAVTAAVLMCSLDFWIFEEISEGKYVSLCGPPRLGNKEPDECQSVGQKQRTTTAHTPSPQTSVLWQEHQTPQRQQQCRGFWPSFPSLSSACRGCSTLRASPTQGIKTRARFFPRARSSLQVDRADHTRGQQQRKAAQLYPATPTGADTSNMRKVRHTPSSVERAQKVGSIS